MIQYLSQLATKSGMSEFSWLIGILYVQILSIWSDLTVHLTCIPEEESIFQSVWFQGHEQWENADVVNTMKIAAAIEGKYKEFTSNRELGDYDVIIYTSGTLLEYIQVRPQWFEYLVNRPVRVKC